LHGDAAETSEKFQRFHLSRLVTMVFGARELSRPRALTGIQSTTAMANGSPFISIQRREFDLLLAISAMKS
jgi:hypothetical protein